MRKMAEIILNHSAVFFLFLSPEKVLSFLAGDIAEENGMTWTMVITSHASCASGVMLPLW